MLWLELERQDNQEAGKREVLCISHKYSVEPESANSYVLLCETEINLTSSANRLTFEIFKISG
jgi:hypothetical protein